MVGTPINQCNVMAGTEFATQMRCRYDASASTPQDDDLFTPVK